jgi:DNA-binding GntR family transcriptional regulator
VIKILIAVEEITKKCGYGERSVRDSLSRLEKEGLISKVDSRGNFWLLIKDPVRGIF